MIKKIQKQLKPDEDFTELNSLMKQPMKELVGEMPYFNNFIPNFTHQCDVLWMPTASRFNRILIVVDTHTKKCDAEPMIGETSTTNAKALATIYKRGILKKPKLIEFDNKI
jgi:hypothetical protein